MASPCLLCLSKISGGGKELAISSLFKLAQSDEGQGTDDDAFVLCPECEHLIDSATGIYDIISRMQVKLKKEIDNIRQVILASEGKVGANYKIVGARQTFINLTGEKSIKYEHYEPEPIDEESVVVKIEEVEETGVDYDDDDEIEMSGPFSPSALMLSPDGGDDCSNSKQENSDDEVQRPKSSNLKRTRSNPNPDNYSSESEESNGSDSDDNYSPESDDEKPEKLPKKEKKIDEKTANLGTYNCGVKKYIYTCAACGNEYNTNMRMILHMFKKHETEDKPFSCPKAKCNKKFTLEVNLQRHKDLHREEKFKPKVCDYCDSRFQSQKRLDVHLKYHKGFPCKLCTRVFSDSSALTHHYRWHKGEKPFQCHICEERFINPVYRNKHVERVHEADIKHPCTLCSSVFDTSYGLNAHVAKVHEEKRLLTCKVAGCGGVFRHYETLRSHEIKMHGKEPFVCDECGMALVSSGSLRKHKKKHTGIKNFKCTECEASYFTAAQLRLHSVAHSNERPFVCSYCGNGFKSRVQLTRHEHRIHSKDYVLVKKWSCSFCEKSFREKCAMEAHVRQNHTGERPFSCQISSCEEKFSGKDMLSKHLRKVHGIFPQTSTERAPRTYRDDRPPSKRSMRRKAQENHEESTSKSSNDCEMQQSKPIVYNANTPGFSGQVEQGPSNFSSAFASQYYNYQNL